VAMNEGYRWKKKLFSQKGRALLEKLSLAPWASRRRKELLELLDQLDPKIAELTAAVEQEAKKRPEVLLLMTHPGVGPITGLVYVLVIGTPDRFPCGKQLGSYTGLIPCEDSSAGRQRLGHISKQGNKLLRYLLGEAAQAAARCNPDWRRRYVHLMMRRQKKIAKVAMARKLAVRLFGDRKPYPFIERRGNDAFATFSPDGKWVAYLSDESGQPEVYVVPFPGPGGKWRISKNGGGQPIWPEGKELFYVSNAFQMIGVQFEVRDNNLVVGKSRRLFEGTAVGASLGTNPDASASIDANRDASRWLVAMPVDARNASPLIFTNNWLSHK
jgi:Transposase IS116/IS110/IS902 family/WD40-like Beta Propeller Repeat